MSRLGIGIGVNLGQLLAAPLLDQLGASITAAWSLRKIRAAYSGSAIRVRRSSDNTEQDIGFNGAGDLDTTALLSFVGAGNGFIRTWYDQSGNGSNLGQAVNNSQPRLVSSGVLDLITTGRPGVKWSGVTQMTTSLTIGASASINGVVRPGTTGSARAWIAGSASGSVFKVGYSTVDLYRIGSSTALSASLTYAAGVATVRTAIASGAGGVQGFKDGASNATSASVPTSNTIDIAVGASPSDTQHWDGETAEVIIISSALATAARQLLERNQGSYYGVSVA